MQLLGTSCWASCQLLPQVYGRQSRGVACMNGHMRMGPQHWGLTRACRAQSCRACAGRGARAKRYFPFAEGARDCLGRNLAAVSMATTLATLLGRLSFRLADQVRPAFAFSTGPNSWVSCPSSYPGAVKLQCTHARDRSERRLDM